MAEVGLDVATRAEIFALRTEVDDAIAAWERFGAVLDRVLEILPPPDV